jgi:L-alanine-DL-glutamate epimerase-like enolase superfamily enzyme
MPYIKEIRHRTVPLGARVFDASLSYEPLTLSLVALVTDEMRDGQPIVGYGLSPIGWFAPAGVLVDRLFPRLRAAPDEALLDPGAGALDPLLALETLLASEPPGRNGELALAAATLEMALWDLSAKLAQQPLARLLAERFNRGRLAEQVEVIAAGGFYRTDVEAPLTVEVARLGELGYAAFEIRVGGTDLTDDLEAIESAVEALGNPELLAVNAGCALVEDRAIAYAEALAGTGLRWFAEPGDPYDFELLEELSEGYEPAFATGGRVLNFNEINNLMRYSALRPELDVLMLDPAACGLRTVLAVRDCLPEYGWVPRSLIAAGGQPLYALHSAAGLGLGGSIAAPLTFGPFGELGEGVRLVDGLASIPDAPGVGFETHGELMAILRHALA